MCDRFRMDLDTIDNDARRLIQDMCGGPRLVPFQTGEIYPTDPVPVLAPGEDGIEARVMLWGFPKWDDKGVVFNVKAETALEKPIVANALRLLPAVIPTSGFYEWKNAPDGKGKEKYLFHEQGRNCVFLAGFCNLYAVGEEGEMEERFTILTTKANAFMLSYSERMPVWLRKNEYAAWLSGENQTSILKRIPFALKGEKVQ